MASIGSGPGIGSGPKLEVNTVRAVAAPDKGAVSASEASVSSANSAAQTPAKASAQAATLVSTM